MIQVKDRSIAILIPIKTINVSNMLTSLRRTIDIPVVVYLFSELSQYDDIVKLRTLCNSLQSNDFRIKLLEVSIFTDRLGYSEDAKSFILEDFIILIKNNLFFIKEKWYQEMYDFIVNFGQKYFSYNAEVTMFKKEWWTCEFFLDKLENRSSGKLIYTKVE